MINSSGSTKERRSLRLPAFEYSQPGFYFVTICCYRKRQLFGKFENHGLTLSEFGKISSNAWSQIPDHFDHVKLDALTVMPNHLHGILHFEGRGTACRAPTEESFGRPVASSLPTVIRSYKSAVTRKINLIRSTHASPVWQRNYYEHIIRSEESLNQYRRYIDENPLRWSLDLENPLNT